MRTDQKQTKTNKKNYCTKREAEGMTPLYTTTQAGTQALLSTHDMVEGVRREEQK